MKQDIPIIGYSGFHDSIRFKTRYFHSLAPWEYRMAQGANSAAALITEAGVVASAAEERFTREKHTNVFPAQAIQFCLDIAGLKPEQVAYLAHGFSYEPVKSAFDVEELTRKQYAEVYDPARQIECLTQCFPSVNWTDKLVSVPHHLAHAASTFYLSGFEESLILITDGMGELHSMTALVGNRGNMEIIQQIPSFHSLGIFYSVFTIYLGFDSGEDEYKVMGLAPYGNPRRYYHQLMEYVRLQPNGTYTIPFFANNKTREEQETQRGVLQALGETFGPARDPQAELTQHHMDLAAALQAVLQTCQLHLLKQLKQQSGQSNLCMAGGVALNCAVNGVIHRSRLFKNLFIQPAAGDDGTALGAALYVRQRERNDQPRWKITMPFWGPEYPEYNQKIIPDEIRNLDDNEYTYFDSIEDLTSHVAQCLVQGQIVAWFQGRMEMGPRALGNRSILADPRSPTMRDQVNHLIKMREGFRPFAPAVVAEKASEFFHIDLGEEHLFAHMLVVAPVRPQYRDQLPAITHVDGSARVQTVTVEQNERFWRLLTDFGKLTGVPILLNTSFNVRGQPIVCTPRQAIATFLRANLDMLVIGNYVLNRNYSETEGSNQSKKNIVETNNL